MQNPTDAQTALAVARLCLTKMGKAPMERPSALYSHYAHELVNAFARLDDAGVFAALDEQTDYASAEDILAESAAMHLTGQLVTLDPSFYGPNAVRPALDPAEWGDTSALDVLRHQTAECACGNPGASPAQHAGTCPVWARHHNLEPTADEYGRAARVIESLMPKGRRATDDC